MLLSFAIGAQETKISDSCSQNEFDRVFFKQLSEFEKFSNEAVEGGKKNNEDIVPRYPHSFEKLISFLNYFDEFYHPTNWWNQITTYQPNPPFDDFPNLKFKLLDWYFENRLLPCLKSTTRLTP